MEKRNKQVFIFFFLPSFIGLLIFYLMPFIGGIYFALCTDAFPRQFVGFRNVTSVIGNNMFRLALGNTLFFSLICAPIAVILAFAVACLLNNISWVSKACRVSILMSYVLPSASVILVWKLFFGYNGSINYILYNIVGKQIDFLGSEHLRIAVLVLYLWRNLGFYMIILHGSMQGIDIEYYEHAWLEGASPIIRHTYITLPLILPTMLFVFLLAWINSLKIFKEIYALGGSYPHEKLYTLQHYINNHFEQYNYSIISNASYIFALIVMIVFAVLFFYERKYRESNFF